MKYLPSNYDIPTVIENTNLTTVSDMSIIY